MMGRVCLSVSVKSSRRPPWAQSLTSSQCNSCILFSERHCSVFLSCCVALQTLPLAVRNLQRMLKD